ncbi:hypothetical protein OsI_15543 [Oryza sativa Indica Group]|uniref:Uncharacterized protein n=1 Tax=Oryza sativa subsp. indica TaxID=39946 RepID=B8ASU2_ORYSI|nr:hypothetical protein OsI_15543 [Oryza sativa Indica Group]
MRAISVVHNLTGTGGMIIDRSVDYAERLFAMGKPVELPATDHRKKTGRMEKEWKLFPSAPKTERSIST